CCELRHARRGCSRAVPPPMYRGRDLWPWQLHVPLGGGCDPRGRPAPGRGGDAERAHSSPSSATTGWPRSRHLCRVGRAYVIRRSTRVKGFVVLHLTDAGLASFEFRSLPARPMVTRRVFFGDANAMEVYARL